MTVMVMERCSGPSLAELLDQQLFLSEDVAAVLMRQMCTDLASLHAAGLVHRSAPAVLGSVAGSL